jgi:hypothetical protein
MRRKHRPSWVELQTPRLDETMTLDDLVAQIVVLCLAPSASWMKEFLKFSPGDERRYLQVGHLDFVSQVPMMARSLV